MSKTNYWLTLHWPPRDDDERDVEGIWLQDGLEDAGSSLAVGDLVFVYESATGRTEVRLSPEGSRRSICRRGKQGVVGLCRVERGLESDGADEPTTYTDHTKIWWRWYAPTRVVSTAGFVPRLRLNEILGYAPKFNFRGFGDKRSGLKKLSKAEFDQILSDFRDAELKAPTAAPASARKGRMGAGGESEDHRLLKEYVADQPGLALGEEGLETRGVEFGFSTGDRADVYLHDRFGRVVGVEVEVEVESDDLVGPLQALKYCAMLEFLADRPLGEGRAVLVAYSIADEVRERCERYQIECYEVSRQQVRAWRDQRMRRKQSNQPMQQTGLRTAADRHGVGQMRGT